MGKLKLDLYLFIFTSCFLLFLKDYLRDRERVSRRGNGRGGEADSPPSMQPDVGARSQDSEIVPGASQMLNQLRGEAPLTFCFNVILSCNGNVYMFYPYLPLYLINSYFYIGKTL